MPYALGFGRCECFDLYTYLITYTDWDQRQDPSVEAQPVIQETILFSLYNFASFEKQLIFSDVMMQFSHIRNIIITHTNIFCSIQFTLKNVVYLLPLSLSST